MTDKINPLSPADGKPAVLGLSRTSEGETKFERAFWPIYRMVLDRNRNTEVKTCTDAAIKATKAGFRALNEELSK